MTLDEYEAIRLMDLENLQQEQAAAQMGVARTTVQLIYNNAHRKLADCLVNGKRLVMRCVLISLMASNRKTLPRQDI